MGHLLSICLQCKSGRLVHCYNTRVTWGMLNRTINTGLSFNLLLEDRERLHEVGIRGCVKIRLVEKEGNDIPGRWRNVS